MLSWFHFWSNLGNYFFHLIEHALRSLLVFKYLRLFLRKSKITAGDTLNSRLSIYVPKYIYINLTFRRKKPERSRVSLLVFYIRFVFISFLSFLFNSIWLHFRLCVIAVILSRTCFPWGPLGFIWLFLCETLLWHYYDSNKVMYWIPEMH